MAISCSKMQSVIVTRPAHQAAPLLAQLAELGYEALPLPLMQIQPIADDPQAGELRALIQNLDHYSAVVVVSMNAAELGLRWLDAYWPQPPVGIDWIAVGPSTADCLRQANLPVHCPTTSFDSEGMLALPCLQAERIAGKKVLLWRGVGGRETLASTLRARGASVDYGELYHRQTVVYSQAQWQQALRQRPVLMLSSTEQIAIVQEQMPDVAQRVCVVITPSERSAKLAQQQGFCAIAAASARDQDMLAALAQFKKQ